MKAVRVRFAPSPTGPLHIGGVRTALYNFLLAKKHGGKMILRIEDTDRSRYVPGAENHIRESLSWLGIHFDEGTDEGGPFPPYRQSEDTAIYQQYARQLVDAGHAYLAFDSEEELVQMRERLKTQDADPQYDSTTRMHMSNSLTLSGAEVKTKLEHKDPYVIRLKTPSEEQVVVQDLIRGRIAVDTKRIDDKVLIKSDGMPTYHLAHVVDDYRMQISHVIRGEEWLPSTPSHVLIYRFLGWEHAMPAFAHLPLLLKPDGKGKLSKRDAEQKGFPILPIAWHDPRTQQTTSGFREQGYLPEALVNFLALLGWNPGTSQELFTREQLIEEFAVEKIHKAGARFVFQKATWFNQQHLRLQSDDQLASYLRTSLAERKINAPDDKVHQIVKALKTRVAFPDDFFNLGAFFFQPPTTFEPKMVAKVWNPSLQDALYRYAEAIKTLTSCSEHELMATLEEVVQLEKLPKTNMMQGIRLALTGGAFGPDLMAIITILGKEETRARMNQAIAHLKTQV